ncbi:MAG: formylglycine-generating enzyme family protein [Kiritimatiellia bacterium]|jgi:formylglycine-generating enzyme required for sulfatase activity
MKKLLAFFPLLAAAALAVPTIDSVSVRQDWPWSNGIVVDYVVSGATENGVDVSLVAFNGTENLGALTSFRSGSLFASKNGANTVVIDPAALPDTGASSLGAFQVEMDVLGEGDPLVDRVEYKIIDLLTHEVADVRRRDIYEHPQTYGACTRDYTTVGPGFQSFLPPEDVFVWTGVNSNDVYKTDKLVLKLIPAKDKVWPFGPSVDDTAAKPAGHWSHPIMGETRMQVKLTKNYYMSVFEMTQQQYFHLTGEWPSFFTNAAYRAKRPVEYVSKSHQQFVAAVNAAHDHGFKIPTEAQWEYAAKAGYDGPGLPNGKAYSSATLTELEGYGSARGNPDRNAAFVTYTVGVGRPNAFGLFNMLGNISEWCSEEPRNDLASYYSGTPEPIVDPNVQSAAGMYGGNYGVFRGGNYNRLWWRYAQRFAHTDGNGYIWDQPLIGWRVILDAE